MAEALVGRSDSYKGDSYGRDDIQHSIEFLKNTEWARNDAENWKHVQTLDRMFQNNQIQFGSADKPSGTANFRIGSSQDLDQIILDKQNVRPGIKDEQGMVELLLHESDHVVNRHKDYVEGRDQEREDRIDRMVNTLRTYFGRTC